MFSNPPCKGKVPLFYPEIREGQGSPSLELRKELKDNEAEAKALCTGCPFQEPCLEHGIKHETYGIWGGATPEERKEMRVERKVSLRRYTVSMNKHNFCGSEKGYRWCIEKGTTCEPCIQAHSVYLTGKTLTEGFVFEEDHPSCGTENGYQNLARRAQKRGGKAAGQRVLCLACREAHRQHSRNLARSK